MDIRKMFLGGLVASAVAVQFRALSIQPRAPRRRTPSWAGPSRPFLSRHTLAAWRITPGAGPTVCRWRRAVTSKGWRRLARRQGRRPRQLWPWPRPQTWPWRRRP